MKISIKGPKSIPKLPTDFKNMISRSDGDTLGKMLVYTMKDLISKGISPIRSIGRFPGYKWAEGLKAARKEAAKIEDSKRRRQFNADIKSAVASKYPYNQKAKYPDKKVRPVNLKLSGAFLKDLGFKLKLGKAGMLPEMQYLSDLSNKKESGHREGVHKQPKRPTLPQGREQPAQSLREIILGALRHSVTEFLKRRTEK